MRLSGASGSNSDVQRVVAFISQYWTTSISDRQAFNKFLIAQGIDQERKAPSAAELNRFQAAFEVGVQKRIQEVRALVTGVLRGPVTFEFFTSLGGTSTEVRTLAYREALTNATGENQLLAVCALSREASEFVASCLSDVPGSPIIDVLREYLHSPGRALGFERGELRDLDRNFTNIELLLRIGRLTPVDQRREIDALGNERRSELASVARHLFRRLPENPLARMIRMRISVFLCLSDPDSEITREACEALISTSDPTVAEVLSLMPGDAALLNAFERLTKVEEHEAAYAAAILDAVRLQNELVLSRGIKRLHEWSKVKSSVLSVASNAALLTLGQVSPAQFERRLLKAARVDNKNELGPWLARNSGFLDVLNLSRFPRRLWVTILDSLVRSSPEAVRTLIRRIAQLKEADATRFWQDTIHALSKADSSPGQLVDDVLLHAFLNYAQIGKLGEFNKEPVRSLVKRHFWHLAANIDEKHRRRTDRS